MSEKEATVEKAVRLGVLARILQRAEILEEDEVLVGVGFDEQINIVTLHLGPRR